MRDKLIHDYAGVDTEIVWRTVREELPGLRAHLASALAKLDAAAGD